MDEPGLLEVLWRLFSRDFVASGVALLVLAWLARAWLQYRIKKDLESFSAELRSSNNSNLRRLEAELQASLKETEAATQLRNAARLKGLEQQLLLRNGLELSRLQDQLRRDSSMELEKVKAAYSVGLESYKANQTRFAAVFSKQLDALQVLSEAYHKNITLKGPGASVEEVYDALPAVNAEVQRVLRTHGAYLPVSFQRSLKTLHDLICSLSHDREGMAASVEDAISRLVEVTERLSSHIHNNSHPGLTTPTSESGSALPDSPE